MEMSLTRGLAEVKTLEDRINRMTAEQKFIGVSRGTGSFRQVPGCANPDEFAKTVKSSFQTIQSLVERRNKIKAAIIAANSSTTFVLNGVTYTIAQAVDRKHSIMFEQRLLDQAKRAFTTAQKMHSDMQDKLQRDIDEKYHQVTLKDKSSKTDNDLMDSISARMRAEYEPGFIDPLGLESLITKMSEDISAFLMNIDFALSEINAITKITIDD